MKKLFKRIFIILGVIIGLFLLAAILVPILFKGKILAVVKQEMNDNLNATTDFKDVDLSLFHSFPHLSVSITQLSILGKGTFSSDTLIAAKSIDVAIDLMKALGGSYDILSVGIIDPRIHAIVHENGEANWNITKPTPPTTTTAPSKPFSMKLRKYGIENAYIEYLDEQGKMHVIMDNLTHEGSGDFTSDAFTLATHTTIDAFTFVMGAIPYLNKVKTAIDIDLEIDTKTSKYSFNTEKIQLNGLRMATKGFVQLPDTINTVMDVQFSTPSNDFKDILSLVPGIYQSNFKDIKTTGKLSLSGMVKGTMNKKQMPAFNLNLAIQDGSFQYPALPQKVNNIQVKLAVENPDGVPDHTVINLEKGHIEFGAEPFDFRMLVKTPVSNQWVDASMKGKVDLSQMQNFVKLEAGTKLAGVINADVSVKGSVAAAQKQKYDDLYAAGTISMTNLTYASKDYPDGVTVNSLLLTFNPKNVTMSNFKGQYLGTNFNGDGTLNNLLAYYLHNDALNGAVHFSADKLDVNKFMGPPSTAAKTPDTSHMSVFVVPSNLDITLTASVGSVSYDKMLLTDMQGTLMIRNEVINLQNIGCKGLDGTIKMDGFYSTKADKRKPDIQFDYNVDGIDIQKTYMAVDMVPKMMPAGKYISGKMSSHLSITAKLGSDMKPDMNSISGKGDMLIQNGLLSNFPITDQLSDKLNISKLKSLPLKDLKMTFSIQNGRVNVDPYKFKIDQIDAQVAGSHGFDQTIKYGVNLSIPTSMMGSQGASMVSGLISQANSKGMGLKMGDKVNLAVNIGGTVTSPKIETNLQSIAGNAVDNVKKQVEQVVQQKMDSVKNVVKDTAKAIKNQVVNSAKEELKKQFMGGGDTTKKGSTKDAVNDAADKAKKGLKGLFGK